jgi:LPXTG-motif cell wall-anchored protein
MKSLKLTSTLLGATIMAATLVSPALACDCSTATASSHPAVHKTVENHGQSNKTPKTDKDHNSNKDHKSKSDCDHKPAVKHDAKIPAKTEDKHVAPKPVVKHGQDEHKVACPPKHSPKPTPAPGRGAGQVQAAAVAPAAVAAPTSLPRTGASDLALSAGLLAAAGGAAAVVIRRRRA